MVYVKLARPFIVKDASKAMKFIFQANSCAKFVNQVKSSIIINVFQHAQMVYILTMDYVKHAQLSVLHVPLMISVPHADQIIC